MKLYIIITIILWGIDIGIKLITLKETEDIRPHIFSVFIELILIIWGIYLTA